ncbi:MAG: HNH endonuclease [Rhodospirillaceae bacterium]|nr:MAG: HNH endonuclease [Rhodospirillaceae bacterium]
MAGVFDHDNERRGALDPEMRRKLVAWSKATPTAMDPNIRLDTYGNQIKLDRYGDRYSEYGWDVDYVVSLSDGGSDAPDNWRALHWRNNASHGGRTAERYRLGSSQSHG